MQNCYEPVINEKEQVIKSFADDEFNSLENRIIRTAEGTSDAFMIKLEEEEYAKTMMILEAIYHDCPIMKHIKDALDKPDFIWDSLFIENIGPDTTGKWYHNTLKADLAAFKKDNTIYDEDFPYFSYIYKVVLYEQYAKFLLEDKKKHQYLIEIDEEMRRYHEKERRDAETETVIADMEQKLAERKDNSKKKTKPATNSSNIQQPTPPEKEDSGMPTFDYTLTDKQIEHLTSIVNELHIFRGDDITDEQLKSILDCSPTVILKSKNNRLLAHLFDQLSRREYITENWQAVIARNMLFKSSQKDDFLNQNDLSTATNKLQDMDMTGNYSKLEIYIKDLKNH